MPSIWSAERLSSTAEDEHRSPFQRDFDRLLFSTPVRRLSDKTQVWPMDESDAVRTRLTHSHEVANLARSIGSRVYKRVPERFEGIDFHEVVEPILSSIGLAHDLGNPPFGHQGEAAIKRWFAQHAGWIFSKHSTEGEGLPHSIAAGLRAEFSDFDGNPQSLRLITRLQTSVGNVGLNLTAATLAASLKYPIGANNQDEGDPIRKKFGYFESEKAVVMAVRERTGLQEGQRHPLTWIMEACDDIAYSVLDVEDAIKKGVISPDDVMYLLSIPTEKTISEAYGDLCQRFEKVKTTSYSPEITKDIKVAYLRAALMNRLIEEASGRFVESADAIFSYKPMLPLMEQSSLCEELKSIAHKYAFGHPSVLRMEARGSDAIFNLMGSFWQAIIDRKGPDKLDSKRLSPKSKYVFSLISPNYVDAANRSGGNGGIETSIRYRELRLLTDMISGMTDTFAIRMWEDIRAIS